VGGVLGDRRGRRVVLIGSVLAFALLTLAASLATNVGTLSVLRFLTGVGLGGAMPNAASLASEFVPLRRRALAVTLTIVCVPLGGSLAGLVAGELLPHYGWRALFAVVGTAPLLLAALLTRVLPESPRFLAQHVGRARELVVLLRGLGHDVPDGVVFTEGAEDDVPTRGPRVALRELLQPELRRDTVALASAFFFALLSVYVGAVWVPTVLVGQGFDDATASYGLSAHNVGGIFGAVLGALAITRFGSRAPMLTMAAGASLGGVLLATMPVAPDVRWAVFAALALAGGLTHAVQTTGYALATYVYPTALRATGVGATVTAGRVGSVLSPVIGSWAISAGGARAFFGLTAITMALAFVALAAIERHVPGRAHGADWRPRA
jgi:AAHS family 4-hydroxybenzoate transporter-like MFS transporter